MLWQANLFVDLKPVSERDECILLLTRAFIALHDVRCVTLFIFLLRHTFFFQFFFHIPIKIYDSPCSPVRALCLFVSLRNHFVLTQIVFCSFIRNITKKSKSKFRCFSTASRQRQVHYMFPTQRESLVKHTECVCRHRENDASNSFVVETLEKTFALCRRCHFHLLLQWIYFARCSLFTFILRRVRLPHVRQMEMENCIMINACRRRWKFRCSSLLLSPSSSSSDLFVCHFFFSHFHFHFHFFFVLSVRHSIVGKIFTRVHFWNVTFWDDIILQCIVFKQKMNQQSNDRRKHWKC